MKSFDFEAWSRLAAKDPAAFQHEKQIALRAVVSQAPERLHERLNQLVDELCSQPAQDGFDAAVQAQNKMLASVADLHTAWARLAQAAGRGDIALPRIALEFTEFASVPDKG